MTHAIFPAETVAVAAEATADRWEGRKTEEWQRVVNLATLARGAEVYGDKTVSVSPEDFVLIARLVKWPVGN